MIDRVTIIGDFLTQVGFSDTGLLNGIDMTYYGDYGCSANDSSVAVAMDWCDNGRVLIYFIFEEKRSRYNESKYDVQFELPLF